MQLEEGFFIVLEKTKSIAEYAILREKVGKDYLLSIAIDPKKEESKFCEVF